MRGFFIYLYFFFSFKNTHTPTGMEIAYISVIIPNVTQGIVIINEANNATINIIGTNKQVGTLSFFVEKVGIRLTIKNDTTHSNDAQKTCDLTI